MMDTIKMPSIAEIKQQINESKARTTQYKSSVDKNFFPFWKMEEGEHAVVRLIPDINSDNPIIVMLIKRCCLFPMHEVKKHSCQNYIWYSLAKSFL